MLPSAVAAGHPATVAAGIEILDDGGSAADAAVAACLASCVAETVMTGFLGGGHAIYWDGTDAWSLDCFVDVPSGTGRRRSRCRSRSARSSSTDAVGPGTCAVPGLRAGWRRCTHASAGFRGHGSWSRRSASRDRCDHAPRPRRLPRHARPGLHDAAGRGSDLRARGRPLEAGEKLDQPGIVARSSCSPPRARKSAYTGRSGVMLAASRAIGVSTADLGATSPAGRAGRARVAGTGF